MHRAALPSSKLYVERSFPDPTPRANSLRSGGSRNVTISTLYLEAPLYPTQPSHFYLAISPLESASSPLLFFFPFPLVPRYFFFFQVLLNLLLFNITINSAFPCPFRGMVGATFYISSVCNIDWNSSLFVEKFILAEIQSTLEQGTKAT